MLSFIKGLFKTEKTTNTIVEGVRDGLDAIWYTKEEEVRDEKELANIRNRATELWLEGLKTDADAASIRSVTRRWIALLVILHYFIWIDVSIVAYALDHKDLAEYAWGVVVEVYWLVFAVASFYFGPGIVERIVRSRNKPTK